MRIKRWMSFFLSLLTIFAVLGFWNVQRVFAADVTSKVKLDNLKITIAATGSESEGLHGESETIVALKYSGDFSFPTVQVNEIKEGDYFIVKAPDNLNLKDQTIDLIDTNSNTKMGTVQVNSKKHQLLFTFNEKVKDKQNIRGNFVATAQEIVTKEEKVVTYVIPGGKTQKITYKVNKYEPAPLTGELLHKSGTNHSSNPQIIYHMRINRSKQNMNGHTIKIKDSLSLGAFATYIESTFSLSEAEFKTTDTNDAGLKHIIKKYNITTDPEVYKKDPEETALLTFTNGKRGFELLMPTNMGTKSFYLNYRTTSPADTSEVKNSAQYLIDNEPQLVWEKWGSKVNTNKYVQWTMKTVKAAGATVTADIAGKIKITKYDEADANVKLEGVEFDIIDKATGQVVDTVKTDKDGLAVSKTLKDSKYIVKEKKTKAGYIVNSQEFEVEMKEGKGVPLNVSNKRETVDFEATKTWLGGKASDYKEVKLGLYVHKEGQTVADSKPVSGSYTPEVTVFNGIYTYKWKNQLPKYDVDGTTRLVYSVRELQEQTNLPLNQGEKVKAGDNSYVVSYNEDKTRITNTYEVPKTKVTAKKVWNGGKADARPKFYFKLYRTLEGGTLEEVAGADLREVPKNDGTVEWENLPATDENAVKYTYSVRETNKEGKNIGGTVHGYTPTQTDTTTITNTYKSLPTKTDILVDKVLIGERPIPLQANEFEFILKDNEGKEIQRAKNDENGRVVFKDIPFDKEGQYKFTVVEAHAGQTIDGVTHDSRTVRVTVSVYDSGQGKLVATPLYNQISTLAAPFANFATLGSAVGSSLPAGVIPVIDNGGIQKFVNTYKAEKAKTRLGVKKTLTGRELKADEFEFTLTDKDGNVKETVKNDKEGNVKFSELTFDTAGIYTYKITEKAGNVSGITYDTKTITATITVTDNGKGTLESTVVYDDEKPFTNKYTPATATKVKIAGKKVLEGKALEAGKYNFALKKADGSVVQTVTNDVDGNFAFDELTYDENQVGTHKYTISEVEGTETGVTYDKTVREVEVKVEKISATELKATVSKEAKDLVFTNKYTPAKTQIPVKKIWDDADNQDGKRPTKITVKLLADGQDTGKTLELSEANGWAGNFTDLDADKGGAPIDYKVVEVSSVAGYTTEISGDAKTGFTITNKYTPETIDIKATKNWDDANNQDGKRPKSITVNLLADGEKVASKEVKAAADGTWSTVFTKLPKFKAGKVIKYSLTEEVVSEYTSEINDFNITNKYTPKMIDYQVTKTWNDSNNQDGKRPDHITVHLMKTVGGVTTEVEKYDIKVAEADPANGNVWKHTFSNLPKYEAGQEIVYSVKEDAVAGYETSIKGQEITNTHTPETIVISGKKVWEDNNNQDGKRTATVKVQILKGKEIVDEIETSEEKGWAFESKPLPKYENGQEIKYEVKEITKIEGYTTINPKEPSADGKYTITNKYTPKTIKVTGQKTWNDNNNQDGKRPTEIKVRLLADGKDTGKVATASETTDWKYSFEGLDRYKAGKEIVYSVEEVDVPKGYQSKANGMNLVNSHTPEVTSVSGQKTWEDENDKDGLRPKEIQVKLLANGKDTGKVATVSEATGWKYSFEKLAKYEAGKAITYTVEEVAVPKGYTAKVDGMNITNSHTPEKPQTPPSTPEKPKKNILPSTGSQSSFLTLLVGLFTLSGAAYLLKKKA